jgi:DNA-binding NtrC family response regulator
MPKSPESPADCADNAVQIGRTAGDSIEDLETLEVVERRHVLRVLRAVEDNKTLAARILGIGRKTLYRMLERWRVAGSADETDSEREAQDGQHR